MSGALHVVAVVPPPVTGMTLVTERMAASFAQSGPTIVHPVQKADGLSGWRWTARKHLAVRDGLKSALAAGSGTIYYVPDAGRGLWGNLALHAPLLARAPKVILHHHVYSYLQSHNATFARFLARVTAKGARITHIALANDMAERLKALYGAADVVVLGNAGFVAPPQSASERPLRLRRLGFLSNVTRDKGIEAFMAVVRETGLEADIAGPVADPSLHADLTRFVEEATDKRRLLGPVYGPQKAAFFDGIDALLFPSQYANEAQPVTIFEALSHALPVLATPQGAIAEQLSGRDWVFDHDIFVQHAANLLSDWAQDKDAFAAASTRAKTIWQDSCAADAAALDALTGSIFPAATQAADSIVEGA